MLEPYLLGDLDIDEPEEAEHKASNPTSQILAIKSSDLSSNNNNMNSGSQFISINTSPPGGSQNTPDMLDLFDNNRPGHADESRINPFAFIVPQKHLGTPDDDLLGIDLLGPGGGDQQRKEEKKEDGLFDLFSDSSNGLLGLQEQSLQIPVSKEMFKNNNHRKSKKKLVGPPTKSQPKTMALSTKTSSLSMPQSQSMLQPISSKGMVPTPPVGGLPKNPGLTTFGMLRKAEKKKVEPQPQDAHPISPARFFPQPPTDGLLGVVTQDQDGFLPDGMMDLTGGSSNQRSSSFQKAAPPPAPLGLLDLTAGSDALGGLPAPPGGLGGSFPTPPAPPGVISKKTTQIQGRSLQFGSGVPPPPPDFLDLTGGTQAVPTPPGGVPPQPSQPRTDNTEMADLDLFGDELAAVNMDPHLVKLLIQNQKSRGNWKLNHSILIKLNIRIRDFLGIEKAKVLVEKISAVAKSDNGLALTILAMLWMEFCLQDKSSTRLILRKCVSYVRKAVGAEKITKLREMMKIEN